MANKIKVEIWGTKPLTNADVLYQLREGGIKMVIGNEKMTSQISLAPDNKIEVITIKNGKVINQFFYKFEEMETINWIRKTYPTEDFYLGYFED